MAGKLCPNGQSRGSACDVGGKQPVPGGLGGRRRCPLVAEGRALKAPRRGVGSAVLYLHL